MKAIITKIFAMLLQIMDLLRELKKTYKNRKQLKDYLRQDVKSGNLWFDTNAFAKVHDIDGHKVLGVFTSDSKSSTINLRNEDDLDSADISRSRGVFYCSVNDISGVNTNQALKLDGKLYTVHEASVVQEYVWRIVLEANED